MGSSKLIGRNELFYMLFLLHQGGVFWVMPYLLVRENGTAGLVALLPGLAAGAITILVCNFWGSRNGELTLMASLTKLLGKPLGKICGGLFVVIYGTFPLICVCSFVEVISGQLLPQTPSIAVLATIFLLVTWQSWNGLEDIARLALLGAVLLVVLMLLVLAGSLDLFSLINMLPLVIQSPEQMKQGLLHGTFAYSGLMVLFMLYPALNKKGKGGHMVGTAILAMFCSTAFLVLWTVLTLGVFGQFTFGGMVWLPLELARMVQLTSFLERTEALFAILWMVIVFFNCSMMFWGASEGLHQLFGMQKNVKFHWSLALLLFSVCTQINTMPRLFLLERLLSRINAVLVPVLLLMVLAGTLLRGRRKGQHGTEQKEGEQPPAEQFVQNELTEGSV